MSTSTDTILTQWLRAATPAERETLAAEAGTTVNYLYQLAGCSRGKNGPNSLTATRMSSTAERMHEATDGRLPLLPVSDLATMCVLRGLDDDRRGG